MRTVTTIATIRADLAVPQNEEMNTSSNTKTDDDRERKARMHTNKGYNHSQDLLMTPQKRKLLLKQGRIL